MPERVPWKESNLALSKSSDASTGAGMVDTEAPADLVVSCADTACTALTTSVVQPFISRNGP